MPVTAASWVNTTYASLTSFTTVSTALPSGDYLIASITGSTSAFGTATMTISDTAGGSWTSVESQTSTQPPGRSWFRTTPGNGGSFTVTITSSVATGLSLLITRFTGSTGQFVASTGSVGGTVVAGGTTPSLTTPVATRAGDLYYSIVRGASTTSTYTAGSGWTEIAQNAFNAVTNRNQFSQRRLAVSASAVTANAVSSAGQSNHGAMAIVIREIPTFTDFSGWGVPL